MNIGGDKTHMAICRYLVSVEGKEKVAIQMSRYLDEKNQIFSTQYKLNS